VGVRGKKERAGSAPARRSHPISPELIVITGVSGSGKGTVLRALEDRGYYSVDNLPLDLIPKFAELTKDSPNIPRAALVVDIREPDQLLRFQAVYAEIKRKIRTQLVFLDADDESLVRRYSETRRPHPLGAGKSVLRSVRTERKHLEPIRALADHVIMTSEMNVHQLRKRIGEMFGASAQSSFRAAVMSFGFRHGVPPESDLVFDVRFLPNPNYIPDLKELNGKNRRVANFIRSFPQTSEFLERVSSLLAFLLPYYMEEGKSYLTIAFGCTGGHHRSVMMAEEVQRRLAKAGYDVKVAHRDIQK
jgi:RNase adapter protein RapZ